MTWHRAYRVHQEHWSVRTTSAFNCTSVNERYTAPSTYLPHTEAHSTSPVPMLCSPHWATHSTGQSKAQVNWVNHSTVLYNLLSLSHHRLLLCAIKATNAIKHSLLIMSLMMTLWPYLDQLWPYHGPLSSRVVRHDFGYRKDKYQIFQKCIYTIQSATLGYFLL